MPTSTPPPTDARALLAHLIAGELGPVAAWRLRRQIARNPDVAREYAEVQKLWGDLKTLQTLDARPAWPAVPVRNSVAAEDRAPRRLTWAAPLPRIALGGTAAIALAVLVANYPRPAIPDAWVRSATSPYVYPAEFRGQIVYYNRQGWITSTYAAAGGSSTPDIQDADQIMIIVSRGNLDYEVRGAGRQSLRDKNNRLIGYVALFPETPLERAQWWARSGKRQRRDVGALPTAGRKKNIGWGQTWGEYPTSKGPLRWEMHGVGLALLRNARTQTVLRRSIARPVDDALRGELRKQLLPRTFAYRVAEAVPALPELTLTMGGKSRIIRGYGTTPVLLPDGTPAQVEILPLDR